MKWLPIKSETLSPFHQQNSLEPHLIDQRSTPTRESQHRIEGIIKPQTSKQTACNKSNPKIERSNRNDEDTGQSNTPTNEHCHRMPESTIGNHGLHSFLTSHCKKQNKKKKRPKHCNQGKQNPLNNLVKSNNF